MTAAEREFDIVVYGATGFVGKLTAEYLARAGGKARIALAGRSPAKLEAVRATLPQAAKDWPILTVDADKPATLDDMALRTRVVLTTVGPYSKYGLPLVAACAKAGTDYCDLTGEAMFVRRSIDDFHKQAIDTKARIVHACGFDSIPSDMTVYELFRRAKADGAGDLGRTDYVLRDFSGGVSGGTIASMIEVFRASSGDPDTRKLLNDPYTLSQDRPAEPEFGAQPDFARRRGAEIAPELAGVWAAGFVMAVYNTRIVRRSNALLDYAYGRGFRYAEYMSVGPSLAAPVASAVTTAATAASAALGGRFFKFLPRRLVERIAPKPGTGPSEEVRENGYYRVETYTTTSSGSRYVATMSQSGDPGYKATAAMIAECALALALDRDKLPEIYGVLTPAAAMGDALLARFPAAGISLESAKLN
ncbi:MAG: enoyl-ACP reductase [Mycobacterium sp.]|nr:enoyl-ACP reductase [Mycobacterium sp.]